MRLQTREVGLHLQSSEEAGLLRCSGLLGEVTHAHLYGATDAAWRHERTVRTKFDVLDSRNGPAMLAEMLELVTSPSAPDTWILVSDDPHLREIAAALRQVWREWPTS